MKNIVSILLFSLISCATQFEYQNIKDEDEVYQKVSLVDIVNSPLNYNDKYIEIDGIYYGSFEQSAIVSSENSKDGIWVDLNSSLINEKGEKLLDDDNRIYNYSKKHLRIKGKFVEAKKGHLGLYKGTITNVVYFGNVTQP